MANIFLSSAASAFADAVGVGSVTILGSLTVGAAASALGAMAGNMLNTLLMPPAARVRGQRLSDIAIMTATEGTAIPLVAGRARVAGHVLHATRFKENSSTRRASKGSPQITTYSYSVSLAIGIAEGEVSHLSAVYADEKPLDLTTLNYRFYTGSQTQQPDPLLQQLHGNYAPAYRGLAYMVFEDLPLAAFGNRIPQLSFEVVRPIADATAIAPLVQGVCLMPGCGEFALSETVVTRNDALASYENRHSNSANSNFTQSLDDLLHSAPQVQQAALVVCQFANDLRAGVCAIAPRVENKQKRTLPQVWYSGGYTRSTAPEVSQYNGAPAYGGTPADVSVLEGIAQLKRRGVAVVYYAFLLCDIAPNNAQQQPAYPWRGRITANSAVDVAAFFGNAQPNHFSWQNGRLVYAGSATDFGYRRMVLHNAMLCKQAGGVDVFVIGSELVGLTQFRVNRTQFVAVDALRSLAAAVRTILPNAKLTYGADWSEDGAWVPNDGSGDVLWPLDALWAELDYIGLDWYAPLTDWRDTDPDPDAAAYATPEAFLQSRIAGGEYYDWYYANAAQRAQKIRTPITDGAYNEPWIFRRKDLVNRWSNAHYTRLGGVRQATPTPWVPRSKPIMLLELGCGAIDKAANAPNLFLDAKSSENAAPPFSRQTPSALQQRAVLRAYLTYYAAVGAQNPLSPLYNAPMLQPRNILLWCWDTRPFPQFPSLSRVWRDAANWFSGHWLNGRLNGLSASALLQHLAQRVGVPLAAASGIDGFVYGYVLSEHSTLARALLPLTQFFALSLAEYPDQMWVTPQQSSVVASYNASNVLDAHGFKRQRSSASTWPTGALLTYANIAQAGKKDIAVTGSIYGSKNVLQLDTTVLTDAATAQTAVENYSASALWQSDTVEFGVLPGDTLHPAQIVAINSDFGTELFAINTVQSTRSATLVQATRTEPTLFTPAVRQVPIAGAVPRAIAPPQVYSFNLPMWQHSYSTPVVHVAAVGDTTWTGALQVVDAALNTLATVYAPLIVGSTVNALWRGVSGQIDPSGALWVQLPAGSAPLVSCSYNNLLNGANTAVLWNTDTAQSEMIQFKTATLVAPQQYKLTGLLRGCNGTEHLMQNPWTAGSNFALCDNAMVPLAWPSDMYGQTASVRVGSVAAHPLSSAYTAHTMTIAGRNLQPLSPARPQVRYAANGDWLLQWTRRSRLDGDAFNAADVPLGEAFEQYALQLWRANGTLVQQLTLTQPFYAYSYAQRVAHNHSASKFAVAQYSQQVGYGAWRWGVL